MIILWKKSLLVFWPSPKNVTEPYCQKWAKNSILLKSGIFLTWPINKKWFFCEKNHFCFSSQVQKMSNLAEIEFLAHFWQYGSVTFFALGQNTRSDFFSQKNHFLFTEQPFLMARKIGCITFPKLLWKILLLRPDVEDFKTLFFCTSMGSPLML